MPRCVILSACPVSARMARYLRPDDFLIACDAGWRNAAALGRSPDLVVGDFDSAPPPAPGWGGEVVRLPAAKDDTDTHYAARLALQRGAREVLMLGALGGPRLEHTLANIATALWLQKQGAEVLLADERTELRILLGGHSLQLCRGGWGYFSLLPLEGAASGVTLTGARFPLADATLTPEFPLGVSNEFAADTVTISLAAGSLAVLCTLGDGAEQPKTRP